MSGKYKITKAGEQDIKVFADYHKIEQVLINLIDNAVKHAPLSTQIVIEVQKVPGHVQISVADQGPGIPEAFKSQLFQRYRLADANLQNEGLGLGLYISSEIIRKHCGKIGVESESGKGSKFWFTLPDVY